MDDVTRRRVLLLLWYQQRRRRRRMLQIVCMTVTVVVSCFAFGVLILDQLQQQQRQRQSQQQLLGWRRREDDGPEEEDGDPGPRVGPRPYRKQRPEDDIVRSGTLDAPEAHFRCMGRRGAEPGIEKPWLWRASRIAARFSTNHRCSSNT